MPHVASCTLVLGSLAAQASANRSAQGVDEMLGSAFGLFMAVVQLIVGLSIAAFAITRGFALVGNMLAGVDIWAELKKRNAAIALLSAGVVLSYTRVIAGGIDAMTDGLQNLVGGELAAGLGAMVAGAINLIVAILVASFAISLTFKVMDRLTTGIDEKEEFKNGNVAIGIVYAGILIGVSGLISAGVSGIGAGVSSFLSSLFRAMGL